MLIAAFDAEHERLKSAALNPQKVCGQLAGKVGSTAQGAVTTALSRLNTDVEKASPALIDIQGLSLWRAALQQVMVAVVAIATILLAVWLAAAGLEVVESVEPEVGPFGLLDPQA